MSVDVRIAEAKDGNGILEVVKEGQTYRLNSIYKPFAEAEKFAKPYTDLEENSVLLVFGFGNGIFADALMKACGQTTKVIFYEPCEAVMECIKECLDVSSFCDSRNCELVTDGIASEQEEHIYAIAEFPIVLNHYVHYHQIKKIQFCVLPKYKELFPEQYTEYQGTIEFHTQMLYANKQTAEALGHITVENNINMLKYIPESYCADSFVNLFPENMPAILVSAGPSLEKNIKELRQAKGRTCIVCVDTAVRYMLRENILPDMIVTIDPRKELSLFDDERIREIPLVGVTDMSCRVLEKTQSKKLILTQTENPYIQNLYAKAGHQLGNFESGGSVATMAYSFCHYLGFKRLILVGQDLALTGNQMYAGKEKLSMDHFGRELIEVEDVYGETLYTTRDYYYYLKWFEQMVELHSEMQVIDATEGGAKIKGTLVMSLQEALAEYAKEEYHVSSIIESVEPVFRQEDRHDLIQKMLHDRRSYNYLVKKLEEGVSLAKKGIKMASATRQSNVQEYKKLNREMMKICEMYDASDANFLVQREIDAADLDNYIKLWEKELTVTTQEQYEIMQQYFECILRAAKSVKAVYDELEFEDEFVK